MNKIVVGKRTVFYSKTLNKILDKYFFLSKRAGRVWFFSGIVFTIIAVIILKPVLEVKWGKNWLLYFNIVLLIYAYTSSSILRIVYKLLYGKKSFFCPYCGSKNQGAYYCSKCSRRIDINGDIFSLKFYKCPVCYKLIYAPNGYRKICPDCGYRFYKPDKKLRKRSGG
jgi:hypothetical protein